MTKYSVMNNTGHLIKESISYLELKMLIKSDKLNSGCLICKEDKSIWRSIEDTLSHNPSILDQSTPPYKADKIPFKHDSKYGGQIRAHLDQMNEKLKCKSMHSHSDPSTRPNLFFVTVIVLFFIAILIQLIGSSLYSQSSGKLGSSANPKPEASAIHDLSFSRPQSYRPNIFTANSSGQEWRKAPLDYRLEYCNLMARANQKHKPGITGQIIFDSLQEFYTSADEGVLSTKIVEAVALTVVSY